MSGATIEELYDLTTVGLPTAVFHATGHPTSMKGASEFVAPGGRLVLVGLFQSEVTFFDTDFHKKELSLLATRNALTQDFQRIIGWVRKSMLMKVLPNAHALNEGQIILGSQIHAYKALLAGRRGVAVVSLCFEFT